jgi:ankyrin repeat protein
VRLLLEKGAEPDSKDSDGQTPLSWATSRRHEAVVRLLKLASKSR